MKTLRLKFWQWAHRRAESLWHWIYFNKLPDGQEAMRKATETRNQTYSYSVTFLNAKGEEIVPHSNGNGCYYLTHDQVDSLAEHQKATLRRMAGQINRPSKS